MSLLVSAESVLGWLGPRWWPPKRLWTVALPELLYPPYFLYFSKSTWLFCFEIPLTKAEPANNGLRFAIYKSRNCDLYIAHLWFIIRTLAIYKSLICYLQSKLLRFISRTFARKCKMQFINRKVTLLAIYKSQSYVAAIYKSQSHVPWDL